MQADDSHNPKYVIAVYQRIRVRRPKIISKESLWRYCKIIDLKIGKMSLCPMRPVVVSTLISSYQHKALSHY